MKILRIVSFMCLVGALAASSGIASDGQLHARLQQEKRIELEQSQRVPARELNRMQEAAPAPLPPEVAAPSLDGTGLYNLYCAACHGQGKKGSPAWLIQNAINNNTGGMGYLKPLSPAQLSAMSQSDKESPRTTFQARK